ncbi:MAG: glutamate--tRNA ligase [Anaerolineaceae bacterium]|nr:glutamate--tRNA ligase [Anaerolineaceae bacterium]
MVRTRFAPSPTGYMHIGNLRTALYAYLFAKRHDGKLILRIEDTDRKRTMPQTIRVIYNSLELAGIEYDEGPEKDGGYGPYTQSQRREIYNRYAAEALEKGLAYRCFCTNTGEKAAKTKVVERRDPCRTLTPEQVQERLNQGQPFVIRQRVPDEGTSTFHDHVFGEITVKNSDLDDQVLLKSDGFPTYNFANVIDDHLMGITHVIRGLEYLSSTPKYNLLYAGFGWPTPEYIHLPHITKENGRKLSKREGDASFEDLLAKGYLPQAVVNYIALLGWNPGDEREFFTLPELIAAFDIDRINKSSASFTLVKLDWLNSQHVRALSPEEFYQIALPYYPAEAVQRFDVAAISRLIQSRVIRLTDIPQMVDFLLRLPDFPVDLFVHEKSKSTIASSLNILEQALPLLQSLETWENLALQEALKAFAQQTGLKTGTVMWPIRIAISGLLNTPGGATEIAEILGREETLRRINQAVSCLRQAA